MSGSLPPHALRAGGERVRCYWAQESHCLAVPVVSSWKLPSRRGAYYGCQAAWWAERALDLEYWQGPRAPDELRDKHMRAAAAILPRTTREDIEVWFDAVGGEHQALSRLLGE